jgi:hypothetical protein
VSVTVKVNGSSNSLVHKGSNGIAQSTVPDVCKTPSPAGPVPVPYPVIISMSSDLANGSQTVKADGGNMIGVKGCEFSRCSGDEAGTAGGVISSTNMKEAKFLLYSFDVKIDGQNACRLGDKMTMNHGNTFCLAGVCQEPITIQELDECEKATKNARKAQALVKDLKSAEESITVAGGTFVPTGGSSTPRMGASLISANMVVPGGKYQPLARGAEAGKPSKVCPGKTYKAEPRPKSGHAEAKILEDLFGGREGVWRKGPEGAPPPKGKLFLQVTGRDEKGKRFKPKPVCCSCQEIIACAQKAGVEVFLCPPSTEEKCS